jgi:Ca2+-binding EF-hand superfamily protein
MISAGDVPATREDRTMKHAIHVGSLVAMCAAAGLVFGQDAAPAKTTPQDAPVQLSSVDTNKDGRISQDEAKSNADLQSVFSTLDGDHDSYLTQAEFSKWNKAAKMGQAAPASDSGKSKSQY